MPQLKTIEDVRVWVASHSARQEAACEARAAVAVRVEKLEIRVTALEKRVMFASGMAAAAGALLGTFLERVF